jgi:hypothetical protein
VFGNAVRWELMPRSAKPVWLSFAQKAHTQRRRVEINHIIWYQEFVEKL